MNYNTYASTSANSGYNPLDKTKREEYNQIKKVANTGLSSNFGEIAPAKLETRGTNIGTVSVNQAPAKLETKGTHIGSANMGGGVNPRNTQIAANTGSNSVPQISYSDSGKMVDYLYTAENLKNSLEFLERNDYPTPQDRELNKQFYGEEKERDVLYNQFMEKTNNALNPKLPDETDRLFLSGFLGDEAEQIEYDRKVSEVKKAKEDLLKQFANTEFAHLLGDTEIYPISVTKAINNDPNAQIKPGTALNRKPGEDMEVEKTGFFKDIYDGVYEYIDENIVGWLGNITKKLPVIRNPEIHRWVWRTGADTLLKKMGCESSSWLLKHSLEENPEDVYRDGTSRIAQLVMKDKQFLKLLDEAITNSNRKTFTAEIVPHFETGDLYYSLHNCKVNVEGRYVDEKWQIKVSLFDKYDFTKIITCMGAGGNLLGKLANDAAAISQNIGAITPFNIYVNFTMER